MDINVLLSVLVPIPVLAVVFFIVMKRKKREPLTYAEFFINDASGKYIHILGARRVMPENGDSFDIYEHYLLDMQTLKLIKGDSQRGKSLDLKSEFVKRSMANLSALTGIQLKMVQPNNNFNHEADGLLKVYRFDQVQSDTEVFDPIEGDSLVFIDQGDEADHFSMNLYRHGNLVKSHRMRGLSDYFFKTIYVEEKNWVCFIYRKQVAGLLSGMAVCILNYENGELVMDKFVRFES